MSDLGFILNEKLIEEDSRVEDLLDFSVIRKSLTRKIDSVTTSSIIGVIGRFGIGKSTTIYQIEKSDNKRLWINFDAWKYPERNNLWEGFILDFAEQTGNHKVILKKIDGKTTGKKELDIFSDIVGSVFKVTGVDVVDKIFDRIFDRTPAKRTFELQKILKNLINNQDRELIIVIEDIDRSGDAGIYFLETLKQFISNVNTKKIIAIVPISDKSFSLYHESYLKCLDYTFNFKPGKIGFEKFVKKIISTKYYANNTVMNRYVNDQVTEGMVIYQISSFFSALFLYFPYMTVRLLKLIIRDANASFINMELDNLIPDIRVILCIEAMKHLHGVVSEHGKETFFERMEKEKAINNSVFSSFLIATALNNTELKDRSASVKFTDTPNEHNQPNTLLAPWYYSSGFAADKGFYLNKSYLNY